MKISPKLIDLVKRGACTLVASLMIAIPFGGKGETKVESDTNPDKIVQEYKQEVINEESINHSAFSNHHWLTCAGL